MPTRRVLLKDVGRGHWFAKRGQVVETSDELVAGAFIIHFGNGDMVGLRPDEVMTLLEDGAATQFVINEWVADMKCSLCQHLIRSVIVKMTDGRFQLDCAPDRCTNPSCQAGFIAETGHTLEVTMYKRQTPSVGEGTD